MKTTDAYSIARGLILLIVAWLTIAPIIVVKGQTRQRARKILAATPPMGWNSWDSYGRTLNEETIKANALWLSKNLKRYGWEYVVVDEGWYLSNLDSGGSAEHSTYQMDEYGRYVPVPGRFPSAGKALTFRPLANYLHSLGLKFGIHIIRGIPKEAVEKNLPIANSRFRAGDAVDTSDLCPWNKYNYGLRNNPAAQAYYDSLASLYAEWQVDFIKIDCISDHPYKGEEIRMFSEAITKSGHPMVLSLSPGPTNFSKRDEVSKYAQMWRISDDVWDVWYSSQGFPQGIKNLAALTRVWAGVARPGHWPDADMLPIGSLRPTAGWGEPRETRLTRDEQRTMLTLWSIFRSPLIMGGNLTRMDDWTKSLLTNEEVIAVNQHSRDNRPVVTTDDIVIWSAKPESGRDTYFAIINLSDSEQSITNPWKELGLSTGSHRVRDLWDHRDLGALAELALTLRPHASALYRVSR